MNHHLKIALITCVFLMAYNSLGFAQDVGQEPTQEVAEFKSYMIDHPFEGCPSGSKCTKDTGIIRKQFAAILKSKKNKVKLLEDFRKKVGIPLSVWSQPVTTVAKGLSLWNSPCSNHNQPEKQILLAEVMASDFRKLKNLKNVIVRKAVVLMNNKLIVYPAIRDESPLYISQEKLVYNLDDEGEYYSIAIGRDEGVNVVTPTKIRNYPENVACPDLLIEKFKQIENPPLLYQGLSCKSIWDVEAKIYRTMAQGWSCG